MQQRGIRPLVNYYNRLDRDESYHIIAGSLLKNISRIHDMNIREVAALCYTSEASITRLSRKAGYEGFNDLREQARKVSKNYYTENRLLMPEALQGKDTLSAYLSSQRRLLDSVERSLSGDLMERAAAMLHEASCVYYFGAGDAFLRLEQDLCVAGKLVDTFRDMDEERLTELDWQPGTLVILENPGYPWFRLDDLAYRVKEAGAKLLLITCSANPKTETLADLSIVMEGTKSGQDEFLFQTVMNILSVEYRRQYLDNWYYGM